MPSSEERKITEQLVGDKWVKTVELDFIESEQNSQGSIKVQDSHPYQTLVDKNRDVRTSMAGYNNPYQPKDAFVRKMS